MLDIFKGDAFTVTSLTDAIKDVRIRPGRLGTLGLFSSSSVSTLTVGIERIGDTIKLVTPTPRGGPGETRDYEKRRIGALSIPHFQRDWAVYADEVQGVRAFGSETALETVQGKVAEKINLNIADLDLTDEYSRIGAIQGVITYEGGQTLDLYKEFGVTKDPTIDFKPTRIGEPDGKLRLFCTQIIRAMRKKLGGTPFSYVHAMVGDDFFDWLLSHPEVRETYKGWSDAKILREGYIGKNRAENPIFEFGDIVWENYGAIDEDGDGAKMGIAADDAQFFPIGVPGLFRTYYAPADYIETVNTMGKRLYAKQWPMPNDKGINGETQSNVLHIATRPGVLLRGSIT